MKALGCTGILLASMTMAACGHHSLQQGPSAAQASPQPKATTSPPKEDSPAAQEMALEIAIGLIVEALTSSAQGEYEDAALSAYVTEIGMKIAKQSERPDLPWHFQVLDSEQIMAHAIPGGRVTISRGLLAFLGSEAEVAAVLAHEVAHVAFRHSHSKWSPSVAVAETGYSAEERARLRDADQERQADTVGARYLASAGYDPRAMVDALSAVERGAAFMLRVHQMKRAEQRTKGGEAGKQQGGKSDEEERDDASGSFDPHPAPPARLARTSVAAGAAFAAGAGVGVGDSRGERGRDRYLARIAGLEWGEGNATPFLSGERYVVPGYLSFVVPRGYKAKSEGGVLQASPASSRSRSNSGSTSAKSGSNNEPKNELVVMRLQKSLVSEALKASITKGPHVKREIVGRPALVARLDPKPRNTKTPSSSSKSKSESESESKKSVVEKKDDTLMAVLEGTGTSVIVVVIKADLASERVLDAFLASGEADNAKRSRASLVTVAQAASQERWSDFLRAHCPDTSLEMGNALNNMSEPTDVVSAGSFIKCVKKGSAAR